MSHRVQNGDGTTTLISCSEFEGYVEDASRLERMRGALVAIANQGEATAYVTGSKVAAIAREALGQKQARNGGSAS
jgi:hypothetical protein